MLRQKILFIGLSLCLAAAYAVDVDLTTMSSTMVYAKVFNMLGNPDAYLGKTIKMNGVYAAATDDKTGKHYHYIIVEDAFACCQQGFEFIRNGKYVYPQDYPPEKTKIEVSGTIKSYADPEYDYTYYYVAVDDFKTVGNPPKR